MKKIIILTLTVMTLGMANVLGQSKDVKRTERNMKHLSGYVYVPKIDGEGGFYVSTSEITNLDYMEFVHHMKTEGGASAAQQVMPDTSLWNEVPEIGATMAEYYYGHPAYHTFPVVCITHEQALAYCEWLEGVLNEHYAEGEVRITVTLPTEEEWKYVAMDGSESNTFPWTGNSLMNEEGKYRANFLAVNQANIVAADEQLIIAEDLQGEMMPVSVHDFDTGAFATSHMAGNVAEFVLEKGITKGGSFADTGYYLKNNVLQTYQDAGASVEHGFRVIVKVN